MNNAKRTPARRADRQNAKPQFKIKNLKFYLAFLPFVVLFFASPCHAQLVSSNELINNAKLYDGKTVSYGGEVIGDIMKRGSFAWVNVNDGVNAIGIWVDISLLKDITYAGNYKSKGDVINVTGEFHRSCLEHGGDLDIHAQDIRKTFTGRANIEPLNMGKVSLAIFLLGLSCILWILKLLKRK